MSDLLAQLTEFMREHACDVEKALQEREGNTYDAFVELRTAVERAQK